MFKKTLLILFGLCMAAAPAMAQEFPNRTVRIVSWAAGTFPDVVARLVAEHLKDAWKQPVIVINRAGVGGVVAAQDAATSPADGYTIVWGDPVGWHLFKKYQVPANEAFAGDSLVPLTGVLDAPLMMAIDARLPAKNLTEFLAYARAQAALGKTVPFGAGGVLSVHHLSAELLARETKTPLQFVAYKSPAEVIPAVSAGELGLAVSGPAGLGEAISAGRVRAIGVTSRSRLETYPDVPTIAETVPNYDITVKAGFYIHKGTAPALIDRISRDVAAAVRTADVSAMIKRSGAIPTGSSAGDFLAAATKDIETLSPVAASVTGK